MLMHMHTRREWTLQCHTGPASPYHYPVTWLEQQVEHTHFKPGGVQKKNKGLGNSQRVVAVIGPKKSHLLHKNKRKGKKRITSVDKDSSSAFLNDNYSPETNNLG